MKSPQTPFLTTNFQVQEKQCIGTVLTGFPGFLCSLTLWR